MDDLCLFEASHAQDADQLCVQQSTGNSTTKQCQLGQASRLSRAVQALWDSLKTQPLTAHHSIISFNNTQASLRRYLPPAAFKAAWQDGREMDFDSMVILVLDHPILDP